jgi:glyoxylase-like metal-dependent hydrolase (beta-lactamase superfamily II)
VNEFEVIDLCHLGNERVIAAYLVNTPDGPALVDCGAATSVEKLRAGLADHGLTPLDLRHLLLTHIHFDHAGAAGVLVRENPALQVHVSTVGAPHLVQPERLEQSARRVFGDDFDRLWGGLVPIPEPNIRPTAERVLDFACFPSPGHASHHVCYMREGILYAGDAAGVRISPSTHVVAPTPPPDIDLEAWDATIDQIEDRAPEWLVLPHFGAFDDVTEHLARLREWLRRAGELVRSGRSEDEFIAALQTDLGEEAARFDHAALPWQSYQGLVRYWAKREAQS